MKKSIKKILSVLLVLLIVIQFIRIDTDNPKVDQGKDFIVLTSPSEEVKTMLNNACYDCHSNTTVYPWYSQIAPVSWWLKRHIDEVRAELNFSEWGDYSAKKADHKLEECGEKVEKGAMPLNSYTWTHRDAKLSADQRKVLTEFFEKLRLEMTEAHDVE